MPLERRIHLLGQAVLPPPVLGRPIVVAGFPTAVGSVTDDSRSAASGRPHGNGGGRRPPRVGVSSHVGKTIAP